MYCTYMHAPSGGGGGGKVIDRAGHDATLTTTPPSLPQAPYAVWACEVTCSRPLPSPGHDWHETTQQHAALVGRSVGNTAHIGQGLALGASAVGLSSGCWPAPLITYHDLSICDAWEVCLLRLDRPTSKCHSFRWLVLLDQTHWRERSLITWLRPDGLVNVTVPLLPICVVVLLATNDSGLSQLGFLLVPHWTLSFV